MQVKTYYMMKRRTVVVGPPVSCIYALVYAHLQGTSGTCACLEKSCQQGVSLSTHIVTPVPIRKSPGLSEQEDI